MPGARARQEEMELRLGNLIDILADEHPDCPEPPETAAAEWTEAEVPARINPHPHNASEVSVAL